ncbi:STAS domain-containing protein [Planomonospora sp. ID67723]|uniref:STAS domain-containing protein n=1 Tax=Planomonospora sp. ID67723 TaxID=2738134 RepID=UPI0018C3F2A7|nr:STAS domain-containing protein [Planomonospora sp. ID67723]MBG0831363.1 STAS domain-containing protein [Planomonospora sp. ID67723]
MTDQVLYADTQLCIVCRISAGRSIIRLIGEIDACNTERVAQTLVQAARIDESFVIDGSALTFIDVAGTRALIRTVGADRTRLQAPPRPLQHILDIVYPLPADTGATTPQRPTAGQTAEPAA